MKHGALFLIHKPKIKSLEWHAPRKKKVCHDMSKGKETLVVFFDYQVLVYYEIIKEGVTINKQEYKEILVRLQWKLLHDNAPAHRAIIVQDYLAKHSVSVLPHPPYSPDIASCDFFFFPKLKITLKWRRFSSSSEVIENAKSGKLGNVHTKNEDTVALRKFREQIKVELGTKDGDRIVLTGLHGRGNVETKRAYPADNEVNRPDKRRQTSDDVRAYPANMRSTVASTRRQTSGDVTLEYIKRACPAAKEVSQFSRCKIADSSSRQIVSGWPAGRNLVSAFPLSDASVSL
ncbi:hypothetical protein LAZ67_2003227 [Cordylochernes scorpioides]|uniref:Transposase n=1 Tax=Cordylochernes scorpioides TaxID=51811 RepID=A0ABY6K2Q1_9ARAC|nr:hypothetical protein LAZ67_2003227 [Cordylochernes scorpioides]